ncbi:hypothetical protein [Mesorhizobium sp. CO1-1-4]|uniref:hypothetical protein n=1 Tax=Mesorhizobium sp. CO1-1-4 TaxID=2876633 RepID=UPI002961F9BD|nr:hypothetical protein [Mesorhizobium sp. CO1-1-4]
MVLTIIVGFTAGGWTLAGTAAEMAKTSAIKARAELAANLCVQKFITASDASQNLGQAEGNVFLSEGRFHYRRWLGQILWNKKGCTGRR